MIPLCNPLPLILLSSSASALQVNSSETVAPPTGRKIQRAVKNEAQAAPKNIPDARITELLDFAKQHHPEVLPLLDFLQAKRPNEFDKVIIKFDRAISRLEKAKQKSPKAYQAGLAAWINQSKIRLYAAQFKIAADAETAAKLRKKIEILVTEKVDARIESLERDQAAVQARADLTPRNKPASTAPCTFSINCAHPKLPTKLLRVFLVFTAIETITHFW